jgi:hypothetical protein
VCRDGIPHFSWLDFAVGFQHTEGNSFKPIWRWNWITIADWMLMGQQMRNAFLVCFGEMD